MTLWAAAYISSAQTPNETATRVERLVAKVKRAKSKAGADEEAHRLAVLVAQTETSKVDQETLKHLVELMDTENDGVRYWVAEAIGFFGPRAQFAAPKLLEVLSETDCLVVDSSSALAIRPTLIKIGVTPPKHECTQFKFPKKNN